MIFEAPFMRQGTEFGLLRRIMLKFLENYHLSFRAFLDYLPALLGAIVCFLLTIFLSNFISKLVSKYSVRRTKDTLIANFIGKIVWAIIFILGTVLALGILGLGTISNKILAGAGITTFIVGFALKDIGENFLSGLLLAFSRPYKVNSLIECDGIKGIVKDMTLRQTTVEAENGKIVLIPNSNIITNPLMKYSTNNDSDLRQEFYIQVEQGRARDASRLISKTISSFDFIRKQPEKPTRVVIDSLVGNKVSLQVVFWFDTDKLKSSESERRSEIIFEVMDVLKKENIVFSG
jgi:small-conductance mechanosensitive channel